MSAFSSFLEAAVINYLRGTDMTAPVSLTLHLYTSDPKDDDSGTEVAGGIGVGYVAQTIVLTAPGTIVGTGSSTHNDATIIFGPATGAWGSITHWAIKSPSLQLLIHGAFLAAKNVGIGDSYSIPVSTLQLLVR